jgi:hypothetical protein
MGKRSVVVGLGIAVAVAVLGCGGGGDAGEPLLSGSLSGDYEGHAFTPAFGFATIYSGTNLIGLGAGPLNCDSPERNDPPAGINAAFTLSTLEPGSYSSVLVNLYYNVGHFEGRGSNAGSVTITSVTDAAVAGSIAYSDVGEMGETYALSGTFEVMRCPG